MPADAPWGPMRIVYLQYASDPIVFFDYRDAYRRPDWMRVPRGPDVSPSLRWYPIVTMLQLVADMLVATNTPMGYGHVYAPEHYVDAWLAVTNVHDWSPEAIRRLKQHLAAGRSAPMPTPPGSIPMGTGEGRVDNRRDQDSTGAICAGSNSSQTVSPTSNTSKGGAATFNLRSLSAGETI